MKAFLYQLVKCCLLAVSPLNDAQQNRNKGNDQQYVNQTAGTVTDKTDCPANYNDHCEDIQ